MAGCRNLCGRTGTLHRMPAKIWTAEELQRLTPAERDAIFDASIVTDLSKVPPAFLAKVRERIELRIATSESSPAA